MDECIWSMGVVLGGSWFSLVLTRMELVRCHLSGCYVVGLGGLDVFIYPQVAENGSVILARFSNTYKCIKI